LAKAHGARLIGVDVSAPPAGQEAEAEAAVSRTYSDTTRESGLTTVFVPPDKPSEFDNFTHCVDLMIAPGPESLAHGVIRRGALDLPIDGGPDVFRAVYGAPQSDGTLTAEGGDTLIMFVTWDKNGRLSSQSIHQFGSATLDESSSHYADQTPLFAAMKTKPVLFTEDELKGQIAADYRP